MKNQKDSLPASGTRFTSGVYVSLLLTALSLIAMLLNGCGRTYIPDSTDVSLDSDEEKVTITLKDCYDSETYPKQTHLDFVSRKEQWMQAHPEVEIKETILRVEDYSTEISYYASQNALPDIFLLGAGSVRLWSEWDLLAEVTDAVDPALMSDFRLVPFQLDGEAYTFPAIAYSPVIIAYDRDALKAEGYDTFPETWEQLSIVNPKFQQSGFDSVLAFYDVNGGNLTQWLMPRIFAENCGEEWLQELISGDNDAVFIRTGVAAALEEIRQIVDSEVLFGHTNPVDAYLEGKCPAAILTVDDLPALQNDPEKWNRTGFSFLPVSDKSLYHETVRNTTHGIMSYALAVSSKTADDTKKLQACLDFCSFVSGSETGADCAAITFEEIMPNFSYYISSGAVSDPLKIWLAGDPEEKYTAEEIINAMQNQYEKAENYTLRLEIKSD